jgi:hypothetical protein
MRTLKFRAWDKLEKKFTYPNSGYQGHYILDLNGRFHNLQNGSGDDDYVVQEFTGCHDAHNKEIYEGDILEYNHGNGINIGYVGFTSGIFFLNYSDENNDELGYLLVSNIKIIGNIFENKELLK